MSVSAAEPAADDVDVITANQLVPISHLELDLPRPAEGWAGYFAARDIPVQEDDLGRASVARSVAKMLLAERRAAEARKAEKLAEQERQAIEADQQRRAQLPRGLPWYEIPAGLTPAEAMTAAERAARPRRESVLDHALSNPTGGVITYHELPRGEE